jgi:uncharacterized protein (DUF58 family)
VLTAELVRKAKRIEVASRRLVDEMLGGQYASVFKGRGLVFSDLRPYQSGDDVRTIDWNVSARMNTPHVKQFVEERDRTINVLLDLSAGSRFGSRGSLKREKAAEIAAAVAFSAIHNHDRVGLMLMTDKLERYVPPKKGRKHVMRIIGEILGFEPASGGTDLGKGLDFFTRVSRGKSVLFVMSDFETTGWERSLGVAARRHEVIPIVVTDPLEQTLPAVGLVQFEDLETGDVIEIDTSDVGAKDYAALTAAQADARDQAMRRLDLDVVTVRTDRDFVEPLVDYFRMRDLRKGRRR